MWRLKQVNFKVRPLKCGFASLSQQLKNDSLSPVFMLSCPGSRVLELSRPQDGNYLTKDVISTFIQKLNLCSSNDAIAATFITSYNPELFSNGLRMDSDHSADVATFIEHANEMATILTKLNKETVAIFSGELSGTAFGVFAGCKYRVGTGLTSFSLRVFEGGVPLGGGLAYHLVKGSREGVAVARYLGVSKRTINAHEMHSLGLLTHIVEDEPHVSLIHALGHSFADNDNVKAYQNDCVAKSAVGELLDTMDVFSDGFGLASNDDYPNSGTASKTAEADIMQDPLWGKILLVPPIPVTDADYADADQDAPHLCDLDEWKHEIEHCFGVDSVTECKARLAKISASASWAEHSLRQLEGLSPVAVGEWFRITRLAARDSLEETMLVERDSAVKLANAIDSKGSKH